MIRRAAAADFPWIARVASQVYIDLGEYGSIIGSWLEHPGVLAYVEELEREDGSRVPRGFILLGFYQPPGIGPGSYVADLLAIAVEPAHQRRGVGRALLDHAIHLARLAGRTNRVPEIRLTVADTNRIGRRLFTSSGFRVLDENHGSYDGGQRAIRMALAL